MFSLFRKKAPPLSDGQKIQDFYAELERMDDRKEWIEQEMKLLTRRLQAKHLIKPGDVLKSKNSGSVHIQEVDEEAQTIRSTWKTFGAWGTGPRELASVLARLDTGYYTRTL